MDIATIVGIVLGLGAIAGSIFLAAAEAGASTSGFVSGPSFAIVFGGMLASVSFAFPLSDVLKLGAAKVYDDFRMAAKCNPDSIFLDGMEGSTGAGPHIAAANTGIPGIAAIREARRALDDVGKTGKVTLIYAGGVRDGADMAKALALGADAIAIGTGALIALNCNKDIPEANFEKEMGVKAGQCYHCHTGRCPVGVATQDPILRKRLNPDDAALRVYNYLHAMTLESQLLARACGKTNIHSLEPEDLSALTMEASALAKVPLAGTSHTVGVDDFHKI